MAAQELGVKLFSKVKISRGRFGSGLFLRQRAASALLARGFNNACLFARKVFNGTWRAT